MKVIIVSHAYNALENRKNIRALSRHVTVKVIAPKMAIKKRFSYHEDYDEKERLIDFIPSVRLFGTQYLLKPMVKQLRAYDPDLINIEYDIWSPITIEMLLLAKLFLPRTKIALTVKKNTLITYGMRAKVKRCCSRVLITKLDAIIASSSLAASVYRDILMCRKTPIYRCIHLGVDKNVFKVPTGPPKCFTVSYVGQYKERKGILELIQALSMINEKGVVAKLLLVGEGPLMTQLVQLSKKHIWIDLRPAVAHAEVAYYLSRSSIFAFPVRNERDHQEHDAHALMEAMSVGLPSVTTQSGAIRDLVSRSSITVDEQSVEQLVSAIKTLMYDKDKYNKMAELAIDESKGFGLDEVSASRASIYKSICNGS